LFVSMQYNLMESLFIADAYIRKTVVGYLEYSFLVFQFHRNQHDCGLEEVISRTCGELSIYVCVYRYIICGSVRSLILPCLKGLVVQ